ncbi:MAG TPA: LON peptidase substrate-binding domain-containing protein [Candidatus Dormibacteraeota bacterium]|nr:LON peptidase substrate-binding domain-containing protein [Candidatus Dormibacteraeota bacterium]
MAVRLPLFPLGTVLFPHMPLSLHVFEQRYRRMLADCDAEGISFGVIAIREGHEVGQDAVPYEVGTLARVELHDRLEDGRSQLLLIGASRFRILEHVTDRPYPAGVVQYLEDRSEPGDTALRLAARLRREFELHLARRREPAVAGTDQQELPDDPEVLAYLVAASLPVDIADRQRLLELDGTEDRLRACLTLLHREQSLVAQLAAKHEIAGSVSMN